MSRMPLSRVVGSETLPQADENSLPGGSVEAAVTLGLHLSSVWGLQVASLF